MRSLLLLSALSAALLPAAPLTITEPPDMPGTGGQTYTVDAGTNTISGFVNGSPIGGPDFADNFSIFVPGGLTVTSTFLSVTNFSNAGGQAGLGCFTGAGCFGAGLGSGMSNPATGSTVSYTAESPWASDGGGGVFVGSYNGTLTLQVSQSQQSAVPEPGTMALVLPVLAGAWWLRRRSL